MCNTKNKNTKFYYKIPVSFGPPYVQATHVQRINEARQIKHCCLGKSVLYSLSVFVALVIQQASPCAVLYCHVACPSLQYFSTLAHKWLDYRL
jgi:hypothetical protein